ncbi:MAG: exopolyphosphatase, partial [Clostridia bacterium]|nr:exopolyphosphatase [Clostridia bacterium]
LHDIGKFISIKKHYVHSHYIIKNSDILGLTNYEHSLIAIIALFHSTMVPNSKSEYYRDLLPSERVRVSKLIAILRLADSLHSSHIKKFDKVSVKIKGKQIIITVYTIENTIYEEWTFNNKRSFFEDVFGLRPIFKKKLVNLYE